MNRIFVATLGAVVMSAAVIAAQAKPAQPATASTDKVTFSGCLQTGGSTGSYLLLSAEQKGAKKGKTSLNVVAASPKVDLDANVTKAVQVTGTLSAPTSKTGTDLPTLTVTNVKWVADYCGVPLGQ